MVRRSAKASAGFTLIEMIVVIVITGIIAGAVAVFIRLPVQGYVDAARRAEMTDIADAALRRMARDIRLALPNSVRVTSTTATSSIEFLPTKIGGRYRIDTDPTSTADPLSFSAPDMQFDQLDVLSPLTGQTITTGTDSIVIYNLGPGITGADAYASTNPNRSLVTGLPGGALGGEQRIQILSIQFPLESPGNRFQVISGPVSYVCDTSAGNLTLTRYWGYSITPTQLSAASLAASGANRALSATNVEKCAFDYTPGVTARSGVVALTLTITESGESAQLYLEVHVNNVP